MRLLTALIVAALLLMACGEDEEPAVQRPAEPIWCPKDREGGFDAREVLGRSADEAERLAEDNGCHLRVVERDGQSQPVTKDLRFDRINVAVRDGVVTRVASIG